jgi:hypothetical protein
VRLARFVGEVARELDLSKIYAHHDAKDGRGRGAYHPLLSTRLLPPGTGTAFLEAALEVKSKH